MQSVETSRTRRVESRVLLIVALVLALLGAMVYAPSRAEATDDIETVRATVTEYYNAKISLIASYKAETANEDAKAIYAQGIAELTSIRDTTVASAETVDALWELKSRATAIYSETVAAAEAIQGSGDPLADAKQDANGVIEYKIHKLRSWIEGCDDEDVIEIVESGVARLRDLFDAVAAAETVDAVRGIIDQAHAIYRETMERAEAAKNGADEPQPKEETEAERRARELRSFRNSVVELAEHKAAILDAAADAARIQAVIDIFETAADTVHGLGEDAEGAATIGELQELKAAILETYEGAKEAAAEVRDDDKTDSPQDAIEKYLEQVVRFVNGTTDAAAEAGPELEDTLAALFEARDAVIDAVEAVHLASASGAGLPGLWDDLSAARSVFRRALVNHYIALGEPMVVAGILIPG